MVCFWDSPLQAAKKGRGESVKPKEPASEQGQQRFAAFGNKVKMTSKQQLPNSSATPEKVFASLKLSLCFGRWSRSFFEAFVVFGRLKNDPKSQRECSILGTSNPAKRRGVFFLVYVLELPGILVWDSGQVADVPSRTDLVDIKG